MRIDDLISYCRFAGSFHFITLLISVFLLFHPAQNAFASSQDYQGLTNGFDFTAHGYANPLDNITTRRLAQAFYAPGYPRSHAGRQHTGLDLMIDAGEPVYSICPGTVVETKDFGDNKAEGDPDFEAYYNARVIVRCDSGPALESPFLVVYGHVRDRAVSRNDTVAMGQRIASISEAYDGDGNRAAGNDHLHFGVNVQNAITYRSGVWGFGTGPNDATRQIMEDDYGFRDPYTYIEEHPYNLPWLASPTPTFPKGTEDAPEALYDARPEFSWTKVDEASSYQFILVEVGGAGEERFIDVPENHYTPDFILTPSSTYKWKVIAKRGRVKARTRVTDGVTETEGASSVQYFHENMPTNLASSFEDVAYLYAQRQVDALSSMNYEETPQQFFSLLEVLARAEAQQNALRKNDAGATVNFEPSKTVSRAELTALCIRASETPLLTVDEIASQGGPHFSDAPATHPLYRYVETARINGDVAGFDDGTFGPDLPVSRSEAAKIAANVFNLTDADINMPREKIIESFDDFPRDPANPDWAAMRRIVNIRAVNGERLWSGFGQGLFHPDDRNIDRAQTAKLLANLVSFRRGAVFAGDTLGESLEQDIGSDATPPQMLTIDGGTTVSMTDAQTLTVSDPNAGSGKSYFWTVTGGSFSSGAEPYETARWTPPRVSCVTDFHLTVSIANGQGYNARGEFTVTVSPAAEPTDDAGFVNYAASFLTNDMARGSNGSLAAVTSRLVLPTAGPYATSIAWTSNREDLIAADGAVTRPANGQGNQAVTLTAVITKGEASATKTFELTVLEREAPPSLPARRSMNFTGEIALAGSGMFATNGVTHQLTVAEPGLLSLTPSTSGTLGDNVHITLTSGETFAKDMGTFAGSEARTATIGAGTYVITVTSNTPDQTGAYQIAATFDGSIASTDELEPNDGLDAAQTLPTGTFTGTLGYARGLYAADFDYFNIPTTTENGIFDLDFEGASTLAGATASFVLDHGVLASGDMSSSTPITVSGLSPNLYNLYFYSPSEDVHGWYRIRGVVTPAPSWVSEREPNDSRDQALPAGRSIIGFADGNDYYSYVVSKDGALTVEISAAGLTANTTLSLVDQYNNSRGLIAMNAGQPLTIPSLEPGTYYIVVKAASGETGQYSLRPVFTPAADHVTESEDNGSIPMADLVYNGRFTGTIGFGNDTLDIFSFDTEDFGSLSAQWSMPSVGPAYRYVTVWDGEGRTIKQIANATLSIPNLAPGTYYVGVSTFSGDYGAYEGAVTLTPNAIENDIDVEPNGDAASAVAMTDGSAAGHIGYVSSGLYGAFDAADCYAFALKARGQTTLAWSADATLNTAYYTLSKADGTQLVSQYFYSGKTYAADLAAGTYSVCVNTYNQEVYGAYGLTVSSTFTDDDGDGLPDSWELELFGDFRQRGFDDPDGDGLTNSEEYQLVTNPLSRDTDGDGMDDLFESRHGLSPTTNDADADLDGDGYSNYEEYSKGSDPGDAGSAPRRVRGAPAALILLVH